jgi:hypothetical protein
MAMRGRIFTATCTACVVVASFSLPPFSSSSTETTSSPLPLFVISEEIDHTNNITTLGVSPSSPPPSQIRERNNPSRNPNPNNLNYLDTLSQTKHSCTQTAPPTATSRSSRKLQKRYI